jgi:hypothetical protein
MLTAKELRDRLSYNAETGLFTWRNSPRKGWAGRLAGSQQNRGYWKIVIGKTPYQAHRLAWLYVYGEWPTKDIDHINGVRDDNRIENLREATRQQNCGNGTCFRNSRSGIRGVYPVRGKWSARIIANRKFKYLGLFKTKDEAAQAYAAAADEAYGEFAAHRNRSERS